MGGHLCSQMGQNGQERDKGGAKEEDTGTGTETTSDGWAISHPTNGLLATLSGKGLPKRPFSGLPAHSVQPGVTFPRFWSILGSFGGSGPEIC